MPPKKKTFVDPDAQRLMGEKLALSGLTLGDAAQLGMEAVPAWRMAEMGFEPLPAIIIKYFAPDGSPMHDWAGTKEPFFRVRYLAKPNDFKTQAGVKEKRYEQKPDTVCCAYFPANWQDWPKTLAGERPLIITEGELKAAAGCANDFPTIGLGGVHNWRSLPKGVAFLPELEAIAWARRYVYITFDSDYMTNPAVCSALKELAQELVQRGAYPMVTTLPQVAGLAKTGLDDLLVADGRDVLTKALKMSDPLGLTQPLFELNDKYVYVRDPGLVLTRGSLSKVSPAAFKEHLESTKSYHETTLMSDGDVRRKAVSAAAAWLGWPLREQAPRMTYAPGEPERLEGSGEYNVWPGWGVQPKKGDVKPFLRLIDHVFEGAEPEARTWFLDWLAWPLQHPGAKMFSSAVLHGRRTGTGKSAIGYTMGRIYGKNFVEINQADLHAGFNEWAEAKQLVMGDDVTGSNKRAEADVLKKLITQDTLRVNVKYVPSFTVPDRINYLFTSNHADVFFLEDDDRRFFIHEVLVGPLEQAFYLDYFGRKGKPGWLDSGGSAAVFDWMLRRDLSKFDPAARAFGTKAKDRMIADTQSDLGGWCRALLADPDDILRMGQVPSSRDLWTSAELLILYDPMGKTGTTANGLGRELKRAGAKQVADGQPIRGPQGSQGRYYAVRELVKWAKASHAECTNHIHGVDVVPVAKPKKQRF